MKSTYVATEEEKLIKSNVDKRGIKIPVNSWFF